MDVCFCTDATSHFFVKVAVDGLFKVRSLEQEDDARSCSFFRPKDDAARAKPACLVA